MWKEMRWTLVDEINDLKVTRQICNILLLKYMKNDKALFSLWVALLFSAFIVSETQKL